MAVVGDTVASDGTILIAPEHGGHMATYLLQLRRLQLSGMSLALPAHGDPIEAPAKVFAGTLARRLMRENKVVDALTKMGPATLAALLPVAYDDAPRALWPIAAMSLEAHLVKLVDEGGVTRDRDGSFCWVADASPHAQVAIN